MDLRDQKIQRIMLYGDSHFRNMIGAPSHKFILPGCTTSYIEYGTVSTEDGTPVLVSNFVNPGQGVEKLIERVYRFPQLFHSFNSVVVLAGCNDVLRGLSIAEIILHSDNLRLALKSANPNASFFDVELFPIISNVSGVNFDATVRDVNVRKMALNRNNLVLNGLRRGGKPKLDKFRVNDSLHVIDSAKQDVLKRILKKVFGKLQ